MKLLRIYKQILASGVILFAVFAGGFAFAPLAAAANPGSACALPDGSAGIIEGDGKTCCPPGGTSSCLFAKYVNPLITLLSAAVGVVVVVAIIVGGIEYSSSAGDPQKAASGKQHIMNALLGLLAYALLYAFLQFIIPGGALHG